MLVLDQPSPTLAVALSRPLHMRYHSYICVVEQLIPVTPESCVLLLLAEKKEAQGLEGTISEQESSHWTERYWKEHGKT